MKNFIIIACILLSACTTAPQAPLLNLNNVEEVSSQIRSEYDGFKKLTVYDAPWIKVNNGFNVSIRVGKADSGLTVYQIYIHDFFIGDDWKRYNSAYDSNGNRLEVKRIDSKVDRCSGKGYCWFEEVVGINISREQMELYKITGQSFKINGKKDEVVFTIPSGYIQAVLATVEGK